MNDTRSIARAAGVVLVMVAVLLGGLLLFLRRESASVGPVSSAPPPPTSVVAPTPVPQPTQPAPTSAPTSAPSPTPQPATPRPARPTATPVVVTLTPAIEQPVAAVTPPPGAIEIQYFIVNGTQVAIYPGTPTPVIPWWQLSQGGSQENMQALIAGYLHFWDLRANALYTLDGSLVRQVMTGRPLTDELAAIDQFRAKNQAQFVDVDHTITVLWATSGEGAVTDVIGDRSYMVDLSATPEPQDRRPANPYRMAYRLQRTSGGTWQVVDSVKIVR